MKSFYEIALIAGLFSILTACGNSSETSSNSTNQAAAKTSPNQIQSFENNAQPTENQLNNINSTAEKKSVMRQLRVEGSNNPNSNVPVITINPDQIEAKNPATTLGDGSEISTVLGAKGAVETRTFKNNPQLAKLERTTDGKNVSVKVYLKNGKIVPVSKEKIQNFTGDSAEQILRAAGIEPKPAPQSSVPKEKTYNFTFPAKPSN